MRQCKILQLLSGSTSSKYNASSIWSPRRQEDCSLPCQRQTIYLLKMANSNLCEFEKRCSHHSHLSLLPSLHSHLPPSNPFPEWFFYCSLELESCQFTHWKAIAVSQLDFPGPARPGIYHFSDFILSLLLTQISSSVLSATWSHRLTHAFGPLNLLLVYLNALPCNLHIFVSFFFWHLYSQMSFSWRVLLRAPCQKTPSHIIFQDITQFLFMLLHLSWSEIMLFEVFTYLFVAWPSPMIFHTLQEQVPVYVVHW